MDITGFIPSKDVREHFRKTGYEFTDEEKATIIHNLDLGIEQVHSLLCQLADETEDTALKQQIMERIAYDRKGIDLFENDTAGCFYEVSFQGDCWYKNGHFATVELAKTFGQSESVLFCIKKYQIIGAKAPQVAIYRQWNWRLWEHSSTERWEEKKKGFEEMDYDGAPIAEVRYQADGAMTDFYSCELPVEEVIRMEDFGAARFEDKYVYIPHPFEAGDIVCSVADPETRGVIEERQEDGQTFRRRVKEENLMADWTDSGIQVLFQGQYDRVLSHDHIIPLYLEYAKVHDMDPRRDPLLAAGRVIRGEGTLGVFLDAYRADL